MINDVGYLIDKLMDFFGVSSNYQLAEKLGMQPSSISSWKNKNSVTAIKKKCRELGIYNEIFGENKPHIVIKNDYQNPELDTLYDQSKNIAIQFHKESEFQALLQNFITINTVLFKIIEKIRGQSLIQKILNVGFGSAGRQMRILYLMFLYLKGQNIQISSSAKQELINAMQNFEIPKEQKINKVWSIRQEDKDSLVELIEKELDDASAAEIIFNLPPLVEEMRKILGPIDSLVADKFV